MDDVSVIVEKSNLQRRYEEQAAAESQPTTTPGSAPSTTSTPPASSTATTASRPPTTTTATTSSSIAHILTQDPESNLEPSAAALPPYSGPSTEALIHTDTHSGSGSGSASAPASSINRLPESRSSQAFPGLPRLDYKLYSPPLFELSQDCTTITSRAPYLSATPSALIALIRSQARVPPKPQIHLRGTRGRKVDFDIRLNLMHLLVPDDPSRRMDYIRCVTEGELAFRGGFKPDLIPEVGSDSGLEEWCRRFVEDTSGVKTFALNRVVANLDTMWLEGQLRSLVASTNYRGVVSVTFPVTHAKVVVQTPDRVNRFFTSVETLFAGKRKWEVVQAVWPFATNRMGEEGRGCAVQSEEVWWREWRDPIMYAVVTRRKGWVTNEDKLEALMEGKGKGVKLVDWGPDYELGS